MSKIKKESVNFQEENKSLEAQFYLESAAKAIQLPGDEYVGSFAIHVYRQRFALQERYTFSCQFVNTPPEQLAIEAAKDLRDNMMRRYGHKLKGDA